VGSPPKFNKERDILVEPPGQLTDTLLDPTSTSAGVFGGDVVALRLDVDFSDSGYLASSSGLRFGDLTVCGLTTSAYGDDLSGFNGTNVRGMIDDMSTVLGGSSLPVGLNVADLDDLASDLTAAFDGGTPSTWAQQHLENGACGWHQGDVTTYGQSEYGSTSVGPAQALLKDDYNSVYASTGGIFIVGSTSSNYIEFDSGTAVHAYLPQTGPPGALDGVLFDPTDSSSGAFSVTKQAQNLHGGEREVGPPKSDADKRVIEVPAFLAAKLAAHLRAYVGPEPTTPAANIKGETPFRASKCARLYLAAHLGPPRRSRYSPRVIRMPKPPHSPPASARPLPR